MADTSVPITAGTGTPIRVLTGLGTGSADQQVVSLADQYGNLYPSAPDGMLAVTSGPTSLLFDSFDGTLANQWATGGTIAPTQASGSLTFNTSTTASATSYVQTVNTFSHNASSYFQAGWVVQVDTASALTNSTRWWGYGQNATTPTSAAPITNGVVFMLDATAGVFYAAAYSAGTRTQTVTLTKPVDGAVHRYQIYFRATRAYFVQDGTTVATITNPNLAQSNNLYLIAGQANAGTSPTSAPTLVASVASASDTASNNHTLSDGSYPSVRATVKKASTAVAATDTALAVGLHPSSPLPAGSNALGTVALTAGAATVGNVGLNAGTAYVGQVRLTDGTNNPTVKTTPTSNATQVLAADNALTVQALPPTSLNASTLGTAATAVTLTLTAPGAGLRHYITGIWFERYISTATTGAASGYVTTSANSTIVFQLPSDTQTIGTVTFPVALTYASPVQSTAQNTATTFTAPAVTGTVYRISVTYFIAP